MKVLERWVLTGLLVIAWLAGGIGPDRDVVVIFGAVLAGFWLLWAYITKRRIVFPRYFGWFCGLVGVATLSLIWSTDRLITLRYVILTAAGALWWVGAKTLAKRQGINQVVRQSILISGVIFTLLWIGNTTKLIPWEYRPSSLVAEASTYKNHNHLGDWWMVMLMMGGEMQLAWLIPGLVMLWACRSRSADLGVMAGWGYLVWSGGWWQKRKRMVIGIGIALVVLFIASGLQKVTLGARDYYVQTIAGVTISNPLGVGLGNFDRISVDARTHWWGRDDYSSVVHNLPLEWMSGMGWLAIVGWIWLGFMSWQMGFETTGNRRRWRAAYWAILINFLFDTTYFLPSLWWLWFVVMGLAEGDE